MRSFFLVVLIAFSFSSNAQSLDSRVSKAVQIVYNQYKLFFDSSLLHKHVVLDKTKSYLVNSETQKIKTLAIADNTFSFNEFNLSFAIVYKGDTIRHLPVCRLDTAGTLMALGTPGNPVRHGDVLPPYLELVKGKIKFDYKKLRELLQEMELKATAIDLQKLPLNDRADNQNIKQEYVWIVTTACPEIKCRELKISASNEKIIEDKKP